MLWEELTSGHFEQAVKDTGGTCVIPFGVIEKHGSHLPLCTDVMIGRDAAIRAAKEEPVIVFPYYFFGQISEARHCPGTIAINPRLQYEMLEEVCREISRNGLKKIIILSSHGGNKSLLEFFIRGCLYAERDYVPYYINLGDFIKQNTAEVFSVKDGHAGLSETARIMAVRPDLVHMDECDSESFKRLGRSDHLQDISTPMDWYANFPAHQAGDPSPASGEMGSRMIDFEVGRLVERIREIKGDNAIGKLLGEFYKKSGEPCE